MIISKFVTIARPVIERFPLVAASYRSIRDQVAFMEEPIVSPWGFKMSGNSEMASGIFEPVETGLVRNLLQDVDVLVNVGANIGYYCCHALSMGKSVIAFEPLQQNLRYLCKNIKINGWSNTEIYPLALSNKVGILELFGGATGASLLKGWADAPDSFVTLVPSSTMDEVLGSKLEGKKILVLVDVEGAEKWMLEGATKLLSNNPKPQWVVEIMTHDHQPAGVKINPNLRSTFELFFNRGYHAVNFDQEMLPITMEQVDLVSMGRDKFKTHNFLFKYPINMEIK